MFLLSFQQSLSGNKVRAQPSWQQCLCMTQVCYGISHTHSCSDHRGLQLHLVVYCYCKGEACCSLRSLEINVDQGSTLFERLLISKGVLPRLEEFVLSGSNRIFNFGDSGLKTGYLLCWLMTVAHTTYPYQQSSTEQSNTVPVLSSRCHRKKA